jgi:hypothetical protein
MQIKLIVPKVVAATGQFPKKIGRTPDSCEKNSDTLVLAWVQI